MLSLVYNNQFFSSRTKALDFRNKKKGKILFYNPDSPSEARLAFKVEMETAKIMRKEIIDPAATPWCVLWNE